MSQRAKHYDVVIIGAGASGLFCALTAAQRGLNVLVLEKANKVGKKILMSGGGRCNFTNHFVEPDNFVSGNPHFAKSALNRYSQWDFITLVEQYRIAYEERKHSQLFCIGSAKEILNILLSECELGGVTIKTHCDTNQIESLPIPESSEKHHSEDTRQRYRVGFKEGNTQHELRCRSVVVATGGLSIPTLGGSGYGYDIAQQFSLALTDRRAGLVPFMFSDALKGLCERLSGLALEVSVSCHDQAFTENMLFTHRGLSGPSMLQISNYWKPGDSILIDLLPDIDAQEWLRSLKNNYGKSLLKTQLHQKLAKPLVKELQSLWWAELAEKPLAEFSDKQLQEIASKLSCWELKPSATEGYRTAEVTLGGVDTDGISSKTMEAKNYPGLFFIGEVLDVSGHLGGFNFQWAWSSGYTAAQFV